MKKSAGTRKNPASFLAWPLLTVRLTRLDQRYSMKPTPPLEMLRFLMEDRSLRHKDIWPVFGNKGLASQVLNGKRGVAFSFSASVWMGRGRTFSRSLP